MILILQFLSYGLVGWTAFFALPYVLARLIGWPGIIVAHIVIGIGVLYWDIAWVQREMRKPEWKVSGAPDLDIIFMFGALLRIIAINIVVTPLGILGAIQRRKICARRASSTS